MRAWISDGSRWRLLWTALGAFATIGGVIGVVDWGYSRFVEDPREERRLEQLERKIDELLAARLVAGASNQLPGQQQQVAEAVAAAEQGAQAGDERFAQALDLLKAGKTEEAAALFRAVAEEKTKRIEQDQREAAAAWRHAGAIAGLADPKTARDAYRRAVALQPDDADAQIWHGWLEKDAGALAAADAAFHRVLALAEQGAAGNTEAMWARFGIGDVLVARGELGAALKSYHDAFAIAERLAAADPANAGWQRDLSVSHNNIGDVLVAQGRLDDALKSYRASLAIAERLAAADPANAGWQFDLGISYERVGNVLVAQGKLDEALAAHTKRHEIIQRLAAADPANAGWQRDLSVSHNNIGDVLVAQGRLDDALKSYRASLAIAERLAAADPANAGWQRDLSISNERMGDMLSKVGDSEGASKAYTHALQNYEKMLQLNPGDVQARLYSVVPLWRLGSLEGAEGPAYLRRALSILKDFDAQGRLDANRKGWIPQIEAQLSRAL